VDIFPFELLYEEHQRIAVEAEKRGVVIRLLGALAFSLRCPQYAQLRGALGRELTDLDYVALSKQWDAIVQLLASLGYSLDERRAMLHGHERIIFFHSAGLRVDVFFDRLDMCHIVDLRGRLNVDQETIPLADLLLEKMQIVRITDKDIIDTIVLFLEHPVTSTDEGVNADYVAQRLAYDWGFYYTATTNLWRIGDEFVDRYDLLSDSDRRTVRVRVGQMLERIEAEPKTLKWKMRARIGTSVKWHKDVGDLVR